MLIGYIIGMKNKTLKCQFQNFEVILLSISLQQWKNTFLFPFANNRLCTGSLDLEKNMKKTSLGIINMGHVLITCIYRRQ